MSVRSPRGPEIALREAPSISEQQVALAEQLGHLRNRLADFLAADNKREASKHLHKE